MLAFWKHPKLKIEMWVDHVWIHFYEWYNKLVEINAFKNKLNVKVPHLKLQKLGLQLNFNLKASIWIIWMKTQSLTAGSRGRWWWSRWSPWSLLPPGDDQKMIRKWSEYEEDYNKMTRILRKTTEHPPTANCQWWPRWCWAGSSRTGCCSEKIKWKGNPGKVAQVALIWVSCCIIIKVTWAL